jgi:hypothetical protein
VSDEDDDDLDGESRAAGGSAGDSDLEAGAAAGATDRDAGEAEDELAALDKRDRG